VAAPRTSVLFELYAAGQLANELIGREFERRSLKVGAHSVLLLLERRGPLTPTELEGETGLRPSTLRERMQPLFDGELVRRRPRRDDRRSHSLEVTARGRELIRKTRPLVEAAERALAAELGERLEVYREPLQRLVQGAQATLAEQEERKPRNLT